MCRELTKIHEQVLRGTAAEVSAALPDPVRGEIVLVLEPAGRAVAAASGGAANSGAVAGAGGEAALRTALQELLNAGMGTKKAAGIVAGLTGSAKRDVYDLALSLIDDEDR